MFFPEPREVTAIWNYWAQGSGTGYTIAGSSDTTNGMDGTWETASLPSGAPGYVNEFSSRSGIVPISFTGPKKNVRIIGGSGNQRVYVVHLYGEAAPARWRTTSSSPIRTWAPASRFQPPRTSVISRSGRPWFGLRIKNSSARRTVTNVNIQCDDADFTIGESASGPWVVTINIASLAPRCRVGDALHEVHDPGAWCVAQAAD